jgi:hypothetical protein
MNYFHYFSEIEDRFSRRRGSILLLNTLDWALIESWREAGIPLEAVLRGIDTAFDKHDAKVAAGKARGRSQKVNGLAWCAQAVLQAAEEMVEASTGLAPAQPAPRDSGFEPQRVAAFLDRNANTLESATNLESTNLDSTNLDSTNLGGPSMTALGHGWGSTATITAARLHELATTMRSDQPLPLDELDRILTVLEEKLFAALQASATEQDLVALKSQADRELAPYRAKLTATQLRQIHQQFLHKRLLEQRALPRLSLFYMGHSDMGHSE